MPNVLLVDGDNLLTIGFFALKNHFHKGEHIGGIYHFINTIRFFIEKHHLDKVVVFWDGAERRGVVRENNCRREQCGIYTHATHTQCTP